MMMMMMKGLIRASASALLAASAVSATTGILLPLYVYPSKIWGDGAANWQPALAAMAASPNVPWLAVVNPGDGPGATGSPGNADSNYISGVKQLNAQANAQTIGYVRTDYGSASMAELQANITNWAGWGSADIGVKGIFFDEASADAFDYLSTAVAFARTAFGAAQITAVCNFGGAVDASFYDICDVVVAFESALDDPAYPVYESTSTIEANTPDAGYRAQAAVIVHDFTGTAADGRDADTTLLQSYVQDARDAELGWLYFCSAGYDSITTAPATIGALAAAF
ncbi:Spherulation-specific family 4-domain-containing protein [Xylaria sp. FL1042]|nr:Spherulation-specific family 4-domain-containing protein [Xylaria sp. FL1042]